LLQLTCPLYCCDHEFLWNMGSHEASVVEPHRYAGHHCSTTTSGDSGSCSTNLSVMNASRICSWAHWGRSGRPMRPTLPKISHLMWRIDWGLSRVTFGMEEARSTRGSVYIAASVWIRGKHGASIICITPIRLSYLVARSHRLKRLKTCHPSNQKSVLGQRGRHCSPKSALHSRHISVRSEIARYSTCY